ncbi:hypothetical protein FK530_22650 [Tsukamurella conjunctivitidis]|uniref:Uncharacterized protein n=2 Tax=Tsukamurella TaxID=2060 RepID=A0A5C5RRE6_9ACTN|nr:hypothetical protein [Tsukamurella conjunctivitidis]TWS25636.1 hypothetical protein FK530_22650 [Tsukamurella conjunctivitidis]
MIANRPRADWAVLTGARGRIAVRRARRTARELRAFRRSPTVPSVAGAVALPSAEVRTAAQAAGFGRFTTRRSLLDGTLSAYALPGPAHAQDVLLCRIDTGTATAELTVTAAPSVRNGSAVTALAAGLLAAHEDLRRVSLPLHASAPACAELLAGGFVDEGWTPPPVGGPRARPPVRRDDAADPGWHMFTLFAPEPADVHPDTPPIRYR